MRRKSRLIAGASVAVVVFSAGLWWSIMLNPWNFDFPEHWEPADPDVAHLVFVYGTLTLPPVRWIVKGRAGRPEPAILSGYTREGLDINADPDAEIQGLLLRVNADELRRLDRYERLGIRYERQLMRLDDGTEAWVYRRL